MKKLLIVGASILQLPAICKAKEKGFYVGVIDYNPNAVGIPYADEYFNVSTIDIDGIVDVAKQFKPDGMMTLATDMPMRSIAAACEACNLPGIDFQTAIRATDKAEMIRTFEQHGVEHPWYFVVSDSDEYHQTKAKITLPCILKPTDSAGSRGVVLVQSEDELDDAYAYSRSQSSIGTVIIEEYLKGPEFSVEMMVLDGTPYVLQITHKLTTGAPHFVEMGHSQPSTQTPEVIEKIKDLSIRAVRSLGIHTGPAHVELILTDQGPKMVELGARMGGDCITTHLVPLSTGIDMVGAVIDLACGKKPDITPKFNKGAAIRYLHAPQGILEAVDGIENARLIPGIQEVTIVKEIGTEIGAVNSSGDRLGFVIAQANNEEEAIAACNAAIDCISVSVKPIDNK